MRLAFTRADGANDLYGLPDPLAEHNGAHDSKYICGYSVSC